MPHAIRPHTPSSSDVHGVWWTSEVNDPEHLSLPPADLAWLADHPGTPLTGPLATATPESDAARLDAWAEAGHPEAPDMDDYFAACTDGYKSAHHGRVAENSTDVRGVTVYDGGVLVHAERGWMLAEIDGDHTTIRALLAAIDDESLLHALTGRTATQYADSGDHLLIVCAPEFGPLANLTAWLDKAAALAKNAPAGVEPVEYLPQPGAKPRVFAIDSDGQHRTLRALLTCASDADAATVAHALTMAIADGDVRRGDIEAIIAPLLSPAAMSAANTELDRTAGT
jgi:hypothetical protein